MFAISSHCMWAIFGDILAVPLPWVGDIKDGRFCLIPRCVLPTYDACASNDGVKYIWPRPAVFIFRDIPSVVNQSDDISCVCVYRNHGYDLRPHNSSDHPIATTGELYRVSLQL